MYVYQTRLCRIEKVRNKNHRGRLCAYFIFHDGNLLRICYFESSLKSFYFIFSR